MTSKFFLSITAAAFLAGPVLAQDVEHRIGGKTVPQDQVTEVQQQCDDLRQGVEVSPVAAAAYEEDTDAAAADAAEETAVDLSADLWSEDGRIDTEKLSIELCDEGNFALSVE